MTLTDFKVTKANGSRSTSGHIVSLWVGEWVSPPIALRPSMHIVSKMQENMWILNPDSDWFYACAIHEIFFFISLKLFQHCFFFFCDWRLILWYQNSILISKNPKTKDILSKQYNDDADAILTSKPTTLSHNISDFCYHFLQFRNLVSCDRLIL